jgi:hypothetical protein
MVRRDLLLHLDLDGVVEVAARVVNHRRLGNQSQSSILKYKSSFLMFWIHLSDENKARIEWIQADRE